MKDKAEELRNIMDLIDCSLRSSDDVPLLKSIWNMLSNIVSDLDQQSKEEAEERYDKAIEYLNPTLDHSYFKAIRIASGIDD